MTGIPVFDDAPRTDLARNVALHPAPMVSKPMPAASEALTFLLLLFGGWVNRRQQKVIEYLKEENRVLRELHGDRCPRLTDDQRKRLAVKGKTLGRRLLGEVACIVTPDTILRWYRKLIARKYDGSKNRGPGRSRTSQEVVDLVIKMARTNPSWGYTRLRGALKNLGHDIGRNTIKRILKDHGIEPAPERCKQTTWKTFIKSHLGQIAEADFFTVEVLTLFGLVRYYVFFVIDIESRRVQIANISHQPHDALMWQIARNLTDCEDRFLKDTRYLLCDRDPLLAKGFQSVLEASGVEVPKMPAKSPNLRPQAERFVRSIKEECLSRIVPLGEKHHRRAVKEFETHYHLERNHQGLGNELIEPSNVVSMKSSSVKCRERLGRLLNYYYLDAA